MIAIKSLDYAATEVVSRPGFRLGVEAPSLGEYETSLELGHRIDLDAVRTFIDEAMRRFPGAGTAADIWLAPRLHYALRLTRRQAADRGLWRWLGCVFAPDFVRWRWGSPDEDSRDPESAAKAERFVGADYKHALARLWWMAELFRDGPDYDLVAKALGNQDIPNNLFRMDVAHHRPTVLAAARVLDGKTGRQANALAKAVNSAATTLVIDVIAPDVALDVDATTRWLNDAESLDPGRYFDVLPSGPDDPSAPATSIDRMAELLTELLSEAPVRGRAVPDE